MKRILVIGDTHYGSKYGLCEDYPSGYHPSRVQVELYNYWCEMCDSVGRVDAVIANGDMCDGLDHKSGGKSDWTTDLMEQAEGCKNLLKMIRTDAFYGTQNTPYHGGTNASPDEILMGLLGGSYEPYQALSVEGIKLHAMHKMGYSRESCNRAGALYQQIVSSLLGDSAFGEYKLIIRSHVHFFSQVEYRGRIAFSTPCWKVNDEYLSTQNFPTVPDVGYVLVTVKGEDITIEHASANLDRNDIIKVSTI